MRKPGAYYVRKRGSNKWTILYYTGVWSDGTQDLWVGFGRSTLIPECALDEIDERRIVREEDTHA